MNLTLRRSDRVMAQISSYQNDLGDMIEKALCRLPVYLRYRNAALLDLLRLVMAIINDNGLDCLVTGGMAYDALRGRLTRVHHDIDLMFMASCRAAVLASFKNAGFDLEEKNPYHTRASTGEGLYVDMFSWVEIGQEAMENICGGIMVRVPRHFFASRQSARLQGIQLTLPGNDALKSIRPFVECEEDRQFLAELAGNPLVRYDERRELVVRRITLAVHEYTIAPEP